MDLTLALAIPGAVGTYQEVADSLIVKTGQERDLKVYGECFGVWKQLKTTAPELKKPWCHLFWVVFWVCSFMLSNRRPNAKKIDGP